MILEMQLVRGNATRAFEPPNMLLPHFGYGVLTLALTLTLTLTLTLALALTLTLALTPTLPLPLALALPLTRYATLMPEGAAPFTEEMLAKVRSSPPPTHTHTALRWASLLLPQP